MTPFMVAFLMALVGSSLYAIHRRRRERRYGSSEENCTSVEFPTAVRAVQDAVRRRELEERTVVLEENQHYAPPTATLTRFGDDLGPTVRLNGGLGSSIARAMGRVRRPKPVQDSNDPTEPMSVAA